MVSDQWVEFEFLSYQEDEFFGRPERETRCWHRKAENQNGKVSYLNTLCRQQIFRTYKRYLKMCQ